MLSTAIVVHVDLLPRRVPHAVLVRELRDAAFSQSLSAEAGDEVFDRRSHVWTCAAELDRPLGSCHGTVSIHQAL